MLLDRAAAALWPHLDLTCPLRGTSILYGGLRTKPHGKLASLTFVPMFTSILVRQTLPEYFHNICGPTAGQVAARSTVRTAASMVQDGRDGTIWVKEGPGRISGAAEGPLSDLTFAAKDLYDVSSFMHAVYDHRSACQPQASQTCKASLKHEDVHAQSSLADGHDLLGYAD